MTCSQNDRFFSRYEGVIKYVNHFQSEIAAKIIDIFEVYFFYSLVHRIPAQAKENPSCSHGDVGGFMYVTPVSIMKNN